MLDPAARKREAIYATRLALRRRCQDFFRTHLPGSFSLQKGGEFPTCEFISTVQAKPFTESLDSGFNSYGSLLGITRTYDVWRCDKFPALRLAWRTFDKENERHLVLAANENELLEQEKDFHPAGAIGRAFISRELGLDMWLVRWGLSELVSSYADRLATLRDRSFRALSLSKTSRILDRTQEELMQLRPDVLSIVHDLETMERYGGLARGREYKFMPVDERWGGKKELVEDLSENLARGAHSVRQALADVTENLTVGSNILSTRGNLALQRAVTWMTLVILLLTAVLVFGEFKPK